MMRQLFLLVCLMLSGVAIGQIDTTYTHNRNRAALYSAVIPGAGQIYNEFGHRKVSGKRHRSWWRASIYLSGMAVTGYYARKHALTSAIIRREWEHKNTFGELSYFDKKYELTTLSELETDFVEISGYRDYFIAGFVVCYALNVVDAYIDAHFVEFDVSENLSLNLRPKLFNDYSAGLALSLQFR